MKIKSSNEGLEITRVSKREGKKWAVPGDGDACILTHESVLMKRGSDNAKATVYFESGKPWHRLQHFPDGKDICYWRRRGKARKNESFQGQKLFCHACQGIGREELYGKFQVIECRLARQYYNSIHILEPAHALFLELYRIGAVAARSLDFEVLRM